MRRRHPTSQLFPYTTLFRSHAELEQDRLAELQVPPEHVVRVREVQVVIDAGQQRVEVRALHLMRVDRKSTRLNSSHGYISYAVFCLKKKINDPHFHCGCGCW